MKKLDLHIHTIETVSDGTFEFDLQTLKDYVISSKLDGIAITNHNKFDEEQYKSIAQELNGICTVLPGIEINIGNNSVGHMICITNPNDISDFAIRCNRITAKITDSRDFIKYADLKEIFVDLNKYFWIPHYDKKPALDKSILKEMKQYILCGEVASIKKFVYCIKDEDSLTPVYFSDYRPIIGSKFPTRHTYFDISNINIDSLKICMRDKNKVALTEYESNNLFNVIPGLPISTGLNVVIGERSSGKSYLLDEIYDRYTNVKYIKQFSLIEMNPEQAAKDFTEQIATKRKSEADKYFEPFSLVVNEIKDVSLDDNENKLEKYLSSLLKHAKEADRADMFSKCRLYSENSFSNDNLETLNTLITSVRNLLDAKEYESIIQKHISRDSLLALMFELISEYKIRKEESLKKQWVNGVVTDIKRSLQAKTSATPVSDVDFYDFMLDKLKVKKFNNIVKSLKKEVIIESTPVGCFSIQVKKRPFNSAQELKNHSGKRDVRFSEIFDSYQNNPYEFLMSIKEFPSIKDSDYYQFFSYVEYEILNQYGFPVSGGERAEFNLLQQINDANKYDMLLIDEPESSFDNIFLKSKVNEIIKDLSKSMPVIVVTHNNTVGDSIKPDYIIHTQRNIVRGNVMYERYHGRPSDKVLHSSSGSIIKNRDALLDCLEAGEQAYDERGRDYEMLKD